MNPRIFLSIFALFASLLTLPAAQAESSPQELLEETIDQVIDALHSGPEVTLEEKRQKVLSKLDKRFSFDVIIRRTLGRNWKRLDEKQQEQITVLITDLLIKAYTSELAGTEKKPDVSFLKTEELSPNKIEIHTSITYKGNQVAVNYRLANIKSRGWQVYDILIEGTSIVSNYRGQFDEHFQTGSADELLKLIESKIDDYDK